MTATNDACTFNYILYVHIEDKHPTLTDVGCSVIIAVCLSTVLADEKQVLCNCVFGGDLALYLLVFDVHSRKLLDVKILVNTITACTVVQAVVKANNEYTLLSRLTVPSRTR